MTVQGHCGFVNMKVEQVPQIYTNMGAPISHSNNTIMRYSSYEHISFGTAFTCPNPKRHK